MADTTPHLPKGSAKTIVVCCDGTWQNSDDGYDDGGLFKTGQLQIPTNVTRIGRAIKAETASGRQQIVYYQAGVGTGNTLWDKVVGGGTGLGLSEHCREAYAFLANNWCEDDTIILLGFSRGAYTARSMADLIGRVGLLTKRGLGSFYHVFKDYENSNDEDYKSSYPDLPFENKPPFRDPSYGIRLEKLGLTRLQVPIKAVAVWDTVGSLGIPSISWLERIGISPTNREYSFYDTRLNASIENAFQALALDEQRGPFSPAVWEKPAGSQTNLKQVWFPGVHTNIGGGYADSDISNITMAWMMSQLDPFIEFDPDYLNSELTETGKYYTSIHRSIPSWGLGTVYNSLTGFHILAGKKPRTPGRYYRADHDSSRLTDQPLENTNEYIHACVRKRYGKPNTGTEGKGVYEPGSLKDWKLVSDGQGTNSRWEYVGSDASSEIKPKVLLEDKLGFLEEQLLAARP
ncbi:MAG: hypothetical protein M1825_004629 [Sarcosagium campestre]|nr:MAG: hypothetical protein M1825_004629 [Sarcosagium campestre]